MVALALLPIVLYKCGTAKPSVMAAPHPILVVINLLIIRDEISTVGMTVTNLAGHPQVVIASS